MPRRMTVDITNGRATITMTQEQLGTIRYALARGTEELEDTARYMRREARSDAKVRPVRNAAVRTARAARRVCDALEAATQAWIRTPYKRTKP